MSERFEPENDKGEEVNSSQFTAPTKALQPLGRNEQKDRICAREWFPTSNISLKKIRGRQAKHKPKVEYHCERDLAEWVERSIAEFVDEI
jgi:hypothetical protein